MRSPWRHPTAHDIRLRQKQPLDRSLFPVEARPVFFDCFPFEQHLALVPFGVDRLRPMPTEPGCFQQIVIGLLRLIDYAIAALDQISQFFHAVMRFVFQMKQVWFRCDSVKNPIPP